MRINLGNKKGFTLAELLIVVAIIAVLVAVAIPIFSSQLEKSRESTDLANVRSAYMEVMAAAIQDNVEYKKSDGTYMSVVALKQAVSGWTTSTDNLTVGGVSYGQSNWVGNPIAGSACLIVFDPQTNVMTLKWGYGVGTGSGGALSAAERSSATSLRGGDADIEGNQIRVRYSNGIGYAFTYTDWVTPTAGTVYCVPSTSWIGTSGVEMSTYYKWDGSHWYSAFWYTSGDGRGGDWIQID